MSSASKHPVRATDNTRTAEPRQRSATVAVADLLRDQPFEAAEIDRPVGGEARGGERHDPGRSEYVVDSAVRCVERELCGHPAREDLLAALEPWVQVPAAVAELAQPLVCMSRLPSVLLGPIDLLGPVTPSPGYGPLLVASLASEPGAVSSLVPPLVG